MQPPDPFTSARLGPLTLRNRIVKAATFEGVMHNGAVSDELIEFHRRVAAGGVGMTTVAYCAVSPGGRVHRHTLVLDPALVGDLRRLTQAVHAEGAAISAQIGHAGLVANTRSNRTPTLAPTTRFSAPAMGRVRAATREQLDGVVADFARATRVAAEAEFDAVEVHLGHNYLLSSFMSPNLNKRTDEFGGSLERRVELPRRVLNAVKEAAPPHMAVTAKFNMADGVDAGLWLDESIPMARLIEGDGCLDAMQLTGGSSLLNGMYFFRGDVPMKEFRDAQPPIVGLGLKFYGPKLFPKYPFEEGFFLPFARQFRDELRLPLVLLGGINRRDTIEGAMAEGFEFVAMARALLREPDLVRRMEADAFHEGRCIHCNKCLPTIYTGTRCVLVEPSS